MTTTPTTSTLKVTDPVLLEFAAEVGASGKVAVVGAQTRWDVGGQPAKGVRQLGAPAGVVEYKPEEMTVKVRAGTSVSDLDAELAAAGQRCALPNRGGTVGGAVAVGEDHLGVLGRGPVRDSVLQVRYVSADGVTVTGGGPVVKNVSGFNLPKLMVGSLGVLGCLSEFVLRTNPVPGVSRWLQFADADPFAVFDLAHRPGAVLWNGTSTWVLLEGYLPDVEAQNTLLIKQWAGVEVEAPPPLPQHRWAMPPAALSTVGPLPTGEFVASVGVGRLWGQRPAPPTAQDPVVVELSRRLKTNFDPTGRLNPGRTP